MFNKGPTRRVPHINEENRLIETTKKQASVFRGFCADHDSRIFYDIERKPLLCNYRSAIQTAYRAHCYETLIHSNAALFLSWMVNGAKFDFDFNPEINRAEIENMSHYSIYCWFLKRKFERIMARSSMKKFYFFCGFIDNILPFASTGSFCIETDFIGRKLQRFGSFGRFNYAQFSVLPQKEGKTFFCISAVNDENPYAAHEFVKSIRHIDPNDIGSAILRLCIVHSENTYFDPDFVKSLSSEQRNEILERFDDEDVFEVGAEKPSDALSRPISTEIAGKLINSFGNV